MTYRILSLDGGGSWVLIEVLALMAVFGPDMRGREVLANFDLVAANSGGAIVLGLLVEDKTLAEVLEFFANNEDRHRAFSSTAKFKYQITQWTNVVPKYSAAAKLPALQRMLPNTGTSCLDGVTKHIRSNTSGKPVHLLFTSLDYDRTRATFFRSAKVDGAGWGTGAAATITLAEAVHSSSNPPVKYFDEPAAFPPNLNRYWDGGVAGCNNPVLAAVTEAVGLDFAPADIIALSLGSASVDLPRQRETDLPSPLLLSPVKVSWHGDVIRLAESILDDPPDIATFLAHVMTGRGLNLKDHLPNGSPNTTHINSRIVRMCPLISPVLKNDRWEPPGDLTVADFVYLNSLGLDAIEPREVAAIARYANLWLKDKAPNQPVRMDGQRRKPELGQGRFTEALAAWRALST